MKILLLHQYYLEKNAGGGSRWNEITKYWANAGHEISVIAGMTHYATGEKNAHHKGKYFVHDTSNKNISIVWCHVSEKYNVNFAGRLWGYLSFVFSGIYAGIFKVKGKYDVIIVSSPPLFIGITALVLSFVKRVPYIFEVRDLWPESAIDANIVKNKFIIKNAYCLEKILYKKATLINVLTPAFKKVLIEKKKIDANKIILIPNAADFSISDVLLANFNFSDFRKVYNPDQKFTVIYVGAHGVANHLIQLIDVATALKEHPIQFLLIGDGMQKNALMQEAKKRALQNIVFVDPVSKQDVFKYIIASDVGISILKKADTFKTVFSNKTFDYMACKKPVLMAIEGISKELILEAKAGIFAEPENINAIAEKILFYFQNPSLCKEHGENGYKYAKLNFDREVLAETYMKEIQKKFPEK